MKRQLLILAAALFSAVLLPAVSGGELRLSGEPALWKFTNGSEFPGAKGKYESRDGLLSLSGDFTGGAVMSASSAAAGCRRSGSSLSG